MNDFDMTEPRQKLPDVLIYMPHAGFLLPYMEREFSGMHVVTDLVDADFKGAVMVSTTDIYDATEGRFLNESTPIKTDSDEAKDEQRFIDFCRAKGLKPTILRCANIVATGMEGLPMRLARGLVRMTMFKIRDNMACISLVHGVDVARAAKALIDSGETFNLTDNVETEVNDLLDALVHRIQDKRVYQIKPRWARWLYGRRFYNQLTTTLTFSSEKTRAALGFEPNCVTKYLLTHDYNDESL